MRSIRIAVLLVVISYVIATSLQSVPVLEGRSFSVQYIASGPDKSEGIKRQLQSSENPNEWQYYYFCENAKNEKLCGVWVDEKGNKIKDANNNVKKENDGVVISKSVLGDSGIYTRFPESKDENQAYIERLDVFVLEPPQPPSY